MKNKILLSILITLINLPDVYSNTNIDTINVTDIKNQKQGFWIFWGKMKKDSNYKPDQKVEEGNFLNNLKIGVWKKYFPNNKLASSIHFYNGRPNGEYLIYFEDGTLQEIGTWVNNKQIGVFKRYYENGILHQEFLFNENGKRVGIQKYYYENGNIMYEGTWEEGKKNGVVKEYYENGDIKAERVYINGTFNSEASKFYPTQKTLSNTIKSETSTNSKKESPVANEEEKVNIGYFNGTGNAKLYNSNKQLSMDGLFKDYKLINGKQFQYDENGLLIRVDLYKDGHYIGEGLIE